MANESGGPYNRAIQDVEQLISDLEIRDRDIRRQLAKLNEILSGLRDLATEDRRSVLPAQPVEPLIQSANGSSPFVVEARVPFAPYQKDDIVNLVTEALEKQPGLRSTQLGDLLKDKVTSSAKNPRKLILSTVSYLASRHRIRKSEQGGWELVRR